MSSFRPRAVPLPLVLPVFSETFAPNRRFEEGVLLLAAYVLRGVAEVAIGARVATDTTLLCCRHVYKVKTGNRKTIGKVSFGHGSLLSATSFTFGCGRARRRLSGTLDWNTRVGHPKTR